ncbi:hypothetical protein [Jonesia quinghaiensis]|uniref:hypothetical protein n=1 Tax=Jonesia quinghaiensis TaxID=262806 RepID=UPI0012F8628E|nr:hypothetical protein [Jonesia quinghaiensis]
MAATALFIITTYTVISFTGDISTGLDQGFSQERQVDMYHLTDTLVDPEEFWNFRQSQEQMETIASFYQELTSSETFTFLSIFNQPLFAHDFMGGETFDASFGTESGGQGEYIDDISGRKTRAVKSIQLNQQAFQFYGLTLSSGSVPQWNSITPQSIEIPVVLGHDYQEIYSVGDIIDVEYYFRETTLRVSGFLEEGSSIYLQGTFNTYLDDQIVIPYPQSLSLSDSSAFEHEGILFFAMIGGNIVAPQGTSEEMILSSLSETATASHFHDYTLLNVPTYLIEFTLMRNLVRDNLATLIALGVVITITLGASLSFLSRALLTQRSHRYRILWTSGASLHGLVKKNTLYLVGEYAACAGVVLMARLVLLPNIQNITALTVASLMLSTIFITEAFSHRVIIHRKLVKPT